MISAQGIIATLKKHGVSHVVGLPDNGSRSLFEALWAEADIEVILVSREGEAFGLASGLHLGGQTPVVLLQNTGFLETGDAFRGTAYNMGVPLVSLIGYRGLKTMQPGTARVDTAATFFEPTLKAWNIPYGSMYTDADLGQIDWAFATAKETGLPTAVILAEETT